MKFLQNIPSYLFFTDKGGVAKLRFPAQRLYVWLNWVSVFCLSVPPLLLMSVRYLISLSATLFSRCLRYQAFLRWRSTHRTLPSNTAPESLTQLKV